jgi:AcrR family transcriptional regulator
MEVRERILEKAEEMFLHYGIRSVSMDDIATQLSISKKTIYQSFADKDELVDAVIVKEIHERQQECICCNQEARDAIHEIFMMMAKILEQFRHMNPVVMYDLEKFHYNSYQKFMQHKYEFLLGVIRKNIEWGVEDELYRPDFNQEILAKFRLESMMLAFNIQIFPPSKYNLAEVTQEIIEHFVYGIATMKGYKLIQKYRQQMQSQIHKH